MHFYRLLPRGNTASFGWIDDELKRRGVEFDISELRSGGRLYRIPKSEAHKLPHENGEPYLGTDETGWSLFEGEIWEKDRVSEFGGGDWKKV